MKLEDLLRTTRSPATVAAEPLSSASSAPQVQPIGPPSHPDIRELLARLPAIEDARYLLLCRRELSLIEAVCKAVSADPLYQPPASDLALIRSINSKLAPEDLHEVA